MHKTKTPTLTKYEPVHIGKIRIGEASKNSTHNKQRYYSSIDMTMRPSEGDDDRSMTGV